MKLHSTEFQNRYIDFPLDFWLLRPSGKNEAILTLRTKAAKEINIHICEGYCKLFRAREPELRSLEDNRFSAVELLQVSARVLIAITLQKETCSQWSVYIS